MERLVTSAFSRGAATSRSVTSGAALRHVLEVVEHEQCVPLAQVRPEVVQERHVAALLHAEHAGNRRGDEVGVAERRQLDEPDAVLELVQDLASDGDREPCLARPARACEREQTHVVPPQQRRDGRQLEPPAHERRDRRRQVRLPAPRGRLRRQRGILAENRLLEVLQSRPRLDAELVDEGCPRPAVGLERLRLPPRAVEREHQLPVQALAVRVAGGELLELRHELRVSAKGKVRVEPLLQDRRSRRSSRRVRSTSANEALPAPASAGPRQSASASRRSSARRAGCSSRASATSRSNRSRSSSPGSTWSR